jgi:hypothetical protein
MKSKYFILTALVLTMGFIGTALVDVTASDHDDGEMELKGRNLNLTDLYVFREDWQNSLASNQHLILVMNSNPRSLARQQYYFSTKARYEFHLTRVAANDKGKKPTGSDDVTLRFEFGAPDSEGRQSITLTTIKDGQTTKRSMGKTTTIADTEARNININSASIEGNSFDVFAGLREDPFFFDVERYFRIRGLLAGAGNTLSGPIQGGANVFRSNATAVDFTAGYNVNSIVARVPIAFIQSSAHEPIFDVWETISVPQE